MVFFRGNKIFEDKIKRAKRINYKKKKAKNLNSISNYDEDLKAFVYKSPKKWKHLYTRSAKMIRAKQLGIDYPRKSTRKMLDDLDK